MSDEVKKVKKVIEIDVIEMEIEISEPFFEKIKQAKQAVEDKTGRKMSYGEYIEQAMEDLVQMYDGALQQIEQAKGIIAQQDAMLGGAPPEEEKPVDPDGEPAEVPDELYAHIIKDEDKRTMYQ